jgi:glycosyltransferase involved in cell wall biosynthesis
LSSLQSRFSSITTRLVQHRTTLDPFLDECGPSVRRVGEVSLHGETHDALEASLSSDLVVQIATTAPSTLRASCAATGPAGARVAFEITVTAEGGSPVSRRLVIDGTRIGGWHPLAIPVPAGRPSITMRARLLNDAAGVRARWSVPTLTWRKSAAAMLRSATFALRSYGVAGTARRLRGWMDEAGDGRYVSWFAAQAPDPDALAALRARVASLPLQPRFALIVEHEDADTPDLARRLAVTMDSLDAQVYDAWELWMDPRHAAPVPPQAARARVRTLDERGGDEASARNAVLAASAADFVAVIGAGDRLAPDALFRIAERLAGEPDADVLYCDEDVQGTGVPRRPRFKPDWSPEHLRARMYIGRLLVIRRSLAVSAGGYRARFAGALDYDLALRVTRAAGPIVHLPRVLYHRADETSADREGAHTDAAAALADVYAAEETEVTVIPGARPGIWRARVAIAGSPRVAIVIPTDGQGPAEGGPPLIVECVRNLRARTNYPHYELLVCDNGNLPAEALAFLGTVPHRRATYTWDGAFNFPRKINFAVAQTSAPYVLLLNDDVEPINADWLAAMLEYAQQPAIGAVGAKLFYPDGRLQHVGVAVGVCGVAAHLLHQHPGGSEGCDGIAVTPRNCSAVTGACLLTRRAVYDEVGGFDERLALDFNDVDFCLRVRQAGYRIVYSPHARLFHRESASFGTRQQRPEEIAAMRRRWGSTLEHDPYYNVNLSRQFPDCRPARAPRR